MFLIIKLWLRLVHKEVEILFLIFTLIDQCVNKKPNEQRYFGPGTEMSRLVFRLTKVCEVISKGW